MKFKRQNKIIEIIEKYNIETQDELISKLRESNFDITQATISRDIKELGLVKVSTKDNRYKYSIPQITNHESVSISSKYKSILRDSIIKMDPAMNIVVIKTYPGMAQAAAAALDGMKFHDIVGSLAGDDTVLVVMSDVEKALDITHKIKSDLGLA